MDYALKCASTLPYLTGLQKSLLKIYEGRRHEGNIDKPLPYSDERGIGRQKPSSETMPSEAYHLQLFNKHLNAEQQLVVARTLYGDALEKPLILFGPPGTGKSVTVIETMLQVCPSTLCVCSSLHAVHPYYS